MDSVFPLSYSDSEAVFWYVKRLEFAHRKQFSQLFKPVKGKKKPLFFRLYEVILKSDGFEEDGLRSAIPSKNFRRVCQTLMEKLIHTQMFLEKGDKPRLFLIESALNLGAVEGVRKAVTEELQAALKAEAFEEIFRMLGWVDAARRIYGIQLTADLEDGFPTRRQIVEHLSLEMELSEVLDQCEIGFEFNSPDRLALIDLVRGVLVKAGSHPHFPSRVCQYLLFRLEVRVSLFAGLAGDALDAQARLIKFVFSRRDFSNGEVYREVLLFVHLLAVNGDFDRALETLGMMESFPTTTPLERNLLVQYLGKAKAGIAVYNWDLKLAKEAYESLGDRPGAFRPFHVVDFSLKLATTLFVHGHMKEASRHLRGLLQHPGVERYAVRVWAELLLVASYHDRGESELAYDAWVGVRGFIEREDIPYANLVYALLGKVIDAPSLADEAAIVAVEWEGFLAGCGVDQAGACIPLFDVMQWLEARQRKCSCFDLCQAGDTRWVWVGSLHPLDLAGSLGGVVYPVSGM